VDLRARLEAHVPLAKSATSTPKSSSTPKESKPRGSLVKICGDPQRRKKVNTKQDQSRRGCGFLLSDIMTEQLAEIIRASPQSASTPLQVVGAEEQTDEADEDSLPEMPDWQLDNMSDAAKPGSMPPIPESVLSDCLPYNVELRPHQLEAIRHLLKHRGLIASHSVGSGKTLIGATTALCVLRFDSEIKVIFVSPKSLLLNFQRTLEQSFVDVDWERIRFYTYEKFLIDYENGLVDASNAFLIVDEAHRLRSQIKDDDPYRRSFKIVDDAKTVKAVLKCARKARKVLLLTATPLVNVTLDIVNLVAMARGDLVPMGKRDFHQTLCSKQGKVRDQYLLSSYFEDILSVYIRPQDDTYPIVQMHTVEIPMSREYYAEYLRVETQTISDVQRDVLGPNDLNPFYNGVRRTVNADVEEYNPKLDWVRKHLLEFGSRKTVVFSPFISLGIRQLEQVVADFDVKPTLGVITGDDSEAARQMVIDKHNADEIQVLLISVQAGGLGINLLGARDVIIMQPGWNDVETQQAMGRAIRFKSHNHLPPSERRVDVWKLLLVKPAGTTGEPAADQIIDAITQRKDRAMVEFQTAMRQCSIEKRRV